MPDIVSRSLSVHKEHEVLLKLEAAGFGNSEAQAIIESKGNELAIKTVAYIRQGGYEATISQKRARKIMGTNFLGIVEVRACFGVEFRDEHIKRIGLDKVPFTEAVLKKCKDTHILFAGYPLTIMDIRSKISQNLLDPLERAWYKKLSFARNDKVKMRWYLIRKDIVPDSTGKTYIEQVHMLSKDEEVPRACEMVYMIVLTYLTTGVRLFPGYYARCRDIVKRDKYVCAGSYADKGVAIQEFGTAVYCVGIGASRKIPS